MQQIYINIVSWQDQILDEGQYPDQKKNFIVSNSYEMNDYCDMMAKECNQNDNNCLEDFSNYVMNGITPNKTQIQYGKIFQIQKHIYHFQYLDLDQYITWSNAYQFQWDALTDQQKKKIIMVYFSTQVSKSFLLNSQLKEIGAYIYYIAFQSDGIFILYSFDLKLNQMDVINKPAFGGPFTCTKNSSGQYNSYKYTDPSQFNGFQYMNADGEDCDGLCSCNYFNMKRLFPMDWRCRPWFQASSSQSFSEPYSDQVSGSSDNTITYKITDNIDMLNITQEENMIPIAIQSTDLDLSKIQQRLSQNKNISQEYSYIVAPKTFNYDSKQGYYQLLTMFHPLSNGTVQSILDIEFQNSTNKQEEINQYLAQVQFMLNTNIRQPGCKSIFQTKNVLETIIRNGSEYLTYFSIVNVCYGNLYNQENIIVGYLANAISIEVINSYLNIVTQEFKPIERAIIISYLICILSNAVFLSLLLGLFLQYNFDNPINILITFINQAKPTEINKFSEMINQGEIKTQQELKNLIAAVNSVITYVESQISCLLRDQKEVQENDLIQIYLKALQNFETLENVTGIGICYNNISNLYRSRREFQLSIEFMQKAILNMEHQLEQIKESFYSKKYYLKNQQVSKLEDSRNQSQFVNFNSQIKNTLIQAIDLLWEAQQTFHNLSEIYTQSKDIDECRFINIMCIINIIEASKLMQKNSCLIQEMLNKCKHLIEYYSQFQSFKYHPLYEVVWNKYFLQKALLNRELCKFDKSLKYCLKSLGGQHILGFSNYQTQNYYDYSDVYGSLTLLSQLLEDFDIILTENQQQMLLQDINYFRSASTQNESILQFFEVLFRDQKSKQN
ncbi:hypothetical protein ABPG74_016304 [Tetrahymena malaccensis]